MVKSRVTVDLPDGRRLRFGRHYLENREGYAYHRILRFEEKCVDDVSIRFIRFNPVTGEIDETFLTLDGHIPSLGPSITVSQVGRSISQDKVEDLKHPHSNDLFWF